MYLSSLVRAVINNPRFALHDIDGNKIEHEKIVHEFRCLKTSFLERYQEGDRVGILLKKDYRYLLAILACIDIGLTYVPLNLSFPENRIRQIVDLASIVEIIDECLLINMLEVGTHDGEEEGFSLEAAKPLYIIFTSGSTGEPKGVVISRLSCQNFFSWVERYFGDINSDTRLLQMADFSFDMSVLDIGLLLTRHTACYFTAFDGNIFKLAHEIQNYQISLISTVPNNFNMLLAPGVAERVELDSLRNIFIGGARFSYGLYQKMTTFFDSVKTSIYNFYGPTEVTVYATVNRLSFDETRDTHDHNVSVGTAIDNVSVVIADTESQPDGVGELLLGGVQVMQEYASNPKKSSEAIVELEGIRYYRTGDLAFQDHLGKYYIVGRMDDTIKKRGYRIDLLDIDSYIHKIDKVLDCTSIAVPDEKYENLVITYLIPSSDDVTIDSVKSEMAKLLADYQMPDKLIFMDSFPLNTSGKVCKKTLMTIYKAQYK